MVAAEGWHGDWWQRRGGMVIGGRSMFFCKGKLDMSYMENSLMITELVK